MIVETLKDSYPLSPMQQGMLFHSLYAQQSGVNIEQMICALREKLNVLAFKRAWQRVLERHSVLRTSFCWEGDNEPLQYVHQQVSLPLEQQDWCGLSAQEQTDRLQAYLQVDRQHDFQLTKAPLMRLTLFRLGESDYQFVWTFHHALLDGRSFPIILKEVFAFYDAFCQDEDLQLEQPLNYRDYIQWLQQQDLSKAESFFRQLLQGFTVPTPLVVDQAPQASKNQEKSGFGEQEIRLSVASTSGLQSLAKQHQLTLNTLVQGAWALLLWRYSGEADVVFGATRACRRSSVAGAESMVGLFINTLPVRVSVSPEMPLLPWLKELRAAWIALRDYEHTPLVKIQGWSDLPGSTPLFDSIVVFENYLLNSTLRSQGSRWENLEVRLVEQSNYPLTLVGYVEPELLLKIKYDLRRFDEATIVRMLGHIKTLLESMAGSPWQSLAELPLLTADERMKMLVEWNDANPHYPNGTAIRREAEPHRLLPPEGEQSLLRLTQADYRQDMCIHQLFEAQVELTPDAVAVVFEDVETRAFASVTYQELNHRANYLAHHLRVLGVGPEVLVGICVERSLEMAVGLLSILKAGGACVPLDPTYPMQRLAFMLEDASVPVLLTQKHLLEELPQHQAQVVCLDAVWSDAQESKENPVSGAIADNLAYMIYTSGSTGMPKGSTISHRSLCNRLLWFQKTYRLTERDRIVQKAPLGFDVSAWEFFWPLLAGARVVVARPGGHYDSAYLVKLITEQQITTIQFVPSMLRVLLEEQGLEACSSLKHVFCGGEALSFELKERFFTHLKTKLHNFYGPTETTYAATFWPCEQDLQQIIPIGRPIANTQIYLLDRHLNPVPIGVPGELHIGGVGLARGYFNRPELTSEKFIPNPFNNEPGTRLYKTGDLARYLPDGNIEFLGRIDHQVKLRGFRIELGEIEAALSQHKSVEATIVLVWEDISGNSGKSDQRFPLIGTFQEKHLVAYVVPRQKHAPTTSELRNFLMELLPNYMVPSIFVMLPALPLTPNGKVDRRELKAPDQERPDLERAFVAPRDTVELQLTKIWSEVLGIQPIGVRDNFFELGGHSLNAVRLFAQIEKIFGLNLPLASLFQSPTIEQLTNILRHSGASESRSSLVAIQPSGSKPPLFCIGGSGGEVLYLRDLSNHLGLEQPVYGLQAQGEDELQTLHSRIENMAAHYIKEVRTLQPQGPYFLAGHSMGGLVAYEIAQQLQLQGQKVALLALLDTNTPEVMNYTLPVWAKAYFHVLNFVQLEPKKKLIYAWHRLEHHSKNISHHIASVVGINALQELPQDLLAPEFLPSNIRRIYKLHDLAAKDYVPQVYSGKVTLFKATDIHTHNLTSGATAIRHRYPLLGWDKLAIGGVEVHSVPGAHSFEGSMLNEPHVRVLAQKLQACLDLAQVDNCGVNY